MVDAAFFIYRIAIEMLSPTDQAPTVTNKVAHCRVCKTQWQVQADSDTKGCSFCGADKTAIAIENEEFGTSGRK